MTLQYVIDPWAPYPLSHGLLLILCSDLDRVRAHKGAKEAGYGVPTT